MVYYRWQMVDNVHVADGSLMETSTRQNACSVGVWNGIYLRSDTVFSRDGIPGDDAPDQCIGNHCSCPTLTCHVHEFAINGIGEFCGRLILVFLERLGKDILKRGCVDEVLGWFLRFGCSDDLLRHIVLVDDEREFVGCLNE